MGSKKIINRQFKDRLFKYIFGNPEHKEWTLNLYNAINGSSYTNPDDIELNTIEDIVYMGMKNDVSFLIVDTMNFYEQQSTFSPNVPLRFFMYAGKAYDKFIESHNINVYSSTLQKIPAPRCICFYNGRNKKEDKVILKLSDAFTNSADPQIEVTVTMLNVNYGHNKELMDACEPLREYSWFVEEVRNNDKKGVNIELAVDMTLDNMPEDFVIRQFLLDNRAEVKDVFLTEYNEQKTMAAFRDEYIEEGEANVAIALLKRGKDTVEDIAALTGLSIAKIEELSSQLTDA
ncbi:MAG: hypothetical protein BWZ04_00222 [Firmicutes bacterium ADurb.BinA205]|nr:MAG: hypothetical protein BWZ04_00222 [Firmicutes bacterium ADurb.BinA205]